MRKKSAALLLCGFVSGGLVASVLPSAAQSPAPQITVNSVTDAGGPNPAPAAPAAKAASSGEVLPWANQPVTPVAALPEAEFAAMEAAAQQCSGLFEGACRDVKTCAWVADVTLTDGTLVPARCAARSPLAKKGAKKSTPAKKEAAAPAPNAQAVAVPVAAQSTVTVPQNTSRVVERVDDPPPAPAKKKPAAPRVEAKATPPAPKPEKAIEEPEQQVEAPAPKKPAATAAARPAPSPSFGSFGGFGGDNAVVVTVPPSSE